MDASRLPARRLRRGALALALGAALVFAGNFVVAGKLTWTPGGFALSFGRMLQDGIVKKYLDDHCPDRTLRLCVFKDDLPQDADQWFWGSPLFDQLGRFSGLGKEMERIALGALVNYPALQLETALADTGQQLIDVHTGEGVIDSVWHTYGIIARYAPQLVPAMRTARQQTGELSFDSINFVQYPIALIAMVLLPVIAVISFGAVLPSAMGELAAVVAVAILGNAFICGVLSNPHDRYGARVVWLAVFVVIVAIAERVVGSRHRLN